MSCLATTHAQTTPLFLRIEDVHWAEPDLLKQLARLASDAETASLFLLLTSRIEGDHLDAAWRNRLGETPLAALDLG